MSRLKSFKNTKTGGIIFAVVMIIAGVLLAIFPIVASDIFVTVFGIGMLVWGIVKIIVFLTNRRNSLMAFDFGSGILFALFGLILLLNPKGMTSFALMMVGVSVLIDGIFKIQSGFAARRSGVSGWRYAMIPAVLSAIGGVLIIFNPFGAVKLLVRVIGIVVIISGISNLASALCISDVPPSEIDIEASVRDENDYR